LALLLLAGARLFQVEFLLRTIVRRCPSRLIWCYFFGKAAGSA
jgi:hypothetical protein